MDQIYLLIYLKLTVIIGPVQATQSAYLVNFVQGNDFKAFEKEKRKKENLGNFCCEKSQCI